MAAYKVHWRRESYLDKCLSLLDKHFYNKSDSLAL